MRPIVVAALACVVLVVSVGGVWLAAEAVRAPEPGEHAVAGLEAMDARTAALEGHRVAPALLMAVYEAFGRSGEAEVYDALAAVAAGEALEALYLERMGAMAGGGLDASQTIHEMRLTELASRSLGDAVEMEARWQVVGRVGHEAHEHVRGNAYAAALRLEPVGGAWRITGFELLDVDRTLAGTATAPDPT
jgi:hypothetical protein